MQTTLSLISHVLFAYCSYRIKLKPICITQTCNGHPSTSHEAVNGCDVLFHRTIERWWLPHNTDHVIVRDNLIWSGVTFSTSLHHSQHFSLNKYRIELENIQTKASLPLLLTQLLNQLSSYDGLTVSRQYVSANPFSALFSISITNTKATSVSIKTTTNARRLG